MKNTGIKFRKILWCLAASMLILVSCQSKPRQITFPQITIELNEGVTIQFQLSEDKQALLGQKLPLYKVVPLRNRKNAADYDDKLIKLFIGDIKKEVKQGRYTEYVGGSGDRLDIYKNGCYYYRKSDYDNLPLNMTDEEVLKLAHEFLSDNALLPEGFEAANIVGWRTLNDTITTKSAGFFQEIGGYDMWGRSDIEVEVGTGGIGAVVGIYSDYDFLRNVACMSYEKVQKLDPRKNGQIVYEIDKVPGEIKSIILDDVKIMYYDSPMNQPKLKHIQPIYQFSGTITDIEGNKADYYWTIEAIH